MTDNPCKWHEVPVRDCLTCNNTPTNTYYLKEPEMFGPVMDVCKVCNKEVEADLVAHGHGVAVIDYGCGHTMKATREKTVWINNKTGAIDLEEVKGA